MLHSSHRTSTSCFERRHPSWPPTQLCDQSAHSPCKSLPLIVFSPRATTYCFRIIRSLLRRHFLSRVVVLFIVSCFVFDPVAIVAAGCWMPAAVAASCRVLWLLLQVTRSYWERGECRVPMAEVSNVCFDES